MQRVVVPRALLEPAGSGPDAEAGTEEVPIEGGPEPDTLLSGRLVAGRYEVLGPLAACNMGRVHRARHRGLDRVVCRKVLRPSLVTDPTTVGRLEREARAASHLDHPN